MLFINQGHPERKLDIKLKKQEIVFDTAVFTYELTFDNTDYTLFLKAIEARYLNQSHFVNQFIGTGKIHPCLSEQAFSLTCSHFAFSLRYHFTKIKVLLT